MREATSRSTVAIVSQASTGNLGDALIARATREHLEGTCGSRTVDFSFSPALPAFGPPSVSGSRGIGRVFVRVKRRLHRWRCLIVEGLRFVSSAPRSVIIGGGQLVSPQGQFVNSLLFWAIMGMFVARGRTYVLGVGFDRGRYGGTRRVILRVVQTMVRVIMVRDVVSGLIAEKSLGLRVQYGSDLAFALRVRAISWKVSGEGGLDRTDADTTLLICPGSYSNVVAKHGYLPKILSRKEYLQWIVRVYDEELASFAHIVVTTTTPEQDAEDCAWLARLLRELSYNRVRVEIPSVISEMEMLVACSDRVVTARLHLGILAARLGVEAMLIPATHKLKTFAKTGLLTAELGREAYTAASRWIERAASNYAEIGKR